MFVLANVGIFLLILLFCYRNSVRVLGRGTYSHAHSFPYICIMCYKILFCSDLLFFFHTICIIHVVSLFLFFSLNSDETDIDGGHYAVSLSDLDPRLVLLKERLQKKRELIKHLDKMMKSFSGETASCESLCLLLLLL